MHVYSHKSPTCLYQSTKRLSHVSKPLIRIRVVFVRYLYARLVCRRFIWAQLRNVYLRKVQSREIALRNVDLDLREIQRRSHCAPNDQSAIGRGSSGPGPLLQPGLDEVDFGCLHEGYRRWW